MSMPHHECCTCDMCCDLWPDDANAALAQSQARVAALEAALNELVACKKMKDRTWHMRRAGKSQEEVDAHATQYAMRKYKAWEQAEKILKGEADVSRR